MFFLFVFLDRLQCLCFSADYQTFIFVRIIELRLRRASSFSVSGRVTFSLLPPHVSSHVEMQEEDETDISRERYITSVHDICDKNIGLRLTGVIFISFYVLPPCKLNVYIKSTVSYLPLLPVIHVLHTHIRLQI